MKTKISILILALGVGLASCQSKEDKLRERMASSFKKGKEKVNEEKKLEAEKKASEKARGVIRVQELFDMHKSNFMRFQRDYHKKVKTIRGVISSIAPKSYGSPVIIVNFDYNGFLLGGIHASASKGQLFDNKTLMDYNKGDELEFEGYLHVEEGRIFIMTQPDIIKKNK